VLEALRVAGMKDVVPDARTRALMSSNGAKTIVGSFKFCVNESGDLTAVDTMQPTGYREYDEEILNAIDAWRYEPYRVLDRPVPVCTAVTFVYRPERTTPETPRERALREWDEQQTRNAR
jgi:TonB family protein